MHVLLAAGANEAGPAGSPADQVAAAFDLIDGRAGLRLLATSRLFRTPAHPSGAGPDFINAAARAESDETSPEAALAALHAVEARLGRVRETHWGPRTIDLDLLAVDDLVVPDPATETAWRALGPEEAAARAPDRLILPHPRLTERAFVLIPLTEVAPDWRHPVTRLSVAEMLEALPEEERASAEPLPPRPQVLRQTDLGPDGRASQTSRTVGGVRQQRFHALQIVRLPGSRGVELRCLDAQGREVTDTWHACLTHALDQASREFGLPAEVWQAPLRPQDDA